MFYVFDDVGSKCGTRVSKSGDDGRGRFNKPISVREHARNRETRTNGNNDKETIKEGVDGGDGVVGINRGERAEKHGSGNHDDDAGNREGNSRMLGKMRENKSDNSDAGGGKHTGDDVVKSGVLKREAGRINYGAVEAGE